MSTKTYRDLFGAMPPLSHHPDPQRSQVIEHIKIIAGIIDDAEAMTVFNTCRNRRPVRIIVFDRRSRKWRGVNHLDSDPASRVQVLEQEMLKLKDRMNKMVRMYNQHMDMHHQGS